MPAQRPALCSHILPCAAASRSRRSRIWRSSDPYRTDLISESLTLDTMI
jgi:hypothetical protein